MTEQDPFRGLEDWGRQVERRTTRADRLRRVRRAFTRRRVVLVAVALIATVGLALASPRVGRPTAAADYPTQPVPPGVSVTTSASAAPTDPFVGTPAAAYPKGEAGIVTPDATAVQGFTVAQVTAALQQVRAALVAGRLDPRMLTGHDPAAFLALMAPNGRKAAAKWFGGTGFANVATWIAPQATLDPAEPPRVSGRTTFQSTMADGLRTLRVTTNYVWVYAFRHPGQPLAVVHDEVAWEFPSTVNLRAGDHGMFVGHVDSYTAWVDCAAGRKGLLAPGDPQPGPAPSEDPNALLKPDHALDIADDCGVASASPGAPA